jgi:hypothetical protein
MDVREIGWDGIDWIHLARDRDKWRKWTFGFLKMLRNSWFAELQAASQEGLSSTSLVSLLVS